MLMDHIIFELLALKWPKVHKFGICGHFRDLNVTLKLKPQTSNFPQRLHMKVISSTVLDSSE